MIDFNNEQEQRQRNYGPVPAGSMVLCKIRIEKPNRPAGDDPYISMAKSGLRGLWVKVEVVSGEYAEVFWYENMWLPAAHQKCTLDEGQTKACNMWGARMRAILEASNGFMPKDDSPKAKRARDISSWFDFNERVFPVRVGIAKEPYVKGDKVYWNNAIAAIITPDKKEYRQIMDGGEIITDGPVTGDGSKRPVQNGSGFPDDPGYEQPPASAYESDVPF